MAQGAASKQNPSPATYSDLECAQQCFDDFGTKVREYEDAGGLVGLFSIFCPPTLFMTSQANCDKKKQLEAELASCLASCVQSL
ncbi:MAG: hypothetical protein AB7F66_12280 [Bacteriovoracia bacterium]